MFDGGVTAVVVAAAVVVAVIVADVAVVAVVPADVGDVSFSCFCY